MPPIIDESKCLGEECGGACVFDCPADVLDMNGSGKVYVDLSDDCVHCGQCVAMCPADAITLE